MEWQGRPARFSRELKTAFPPSDKIVLYRFNLKFHRFKRICGLFWRVRQVSQGVILFVIQGAISIAFQLLKP